MADELLKRNTDCVYFLASPFTCKKGVECEYRHSEMARLNPQDCWYWQSGSCLNPTCAFRHPPLESHNEATTNAAMPPIKNQASMPPIKNQSSMPPTKNQSSMPPTKNTVPCYYYYNGFCNKGDRCPFMHEPGETFLFKPKTANPVADAPVLPLDSKKHVRVDAEPIPTGKHAILPEVAMTSGNKLQNEKKQLDHQHSISAVLQEPSISKQTYISQCEETAAVKTVSLHPVECSTKDECEASLDSDRCSEELVDGSLVHDELWESSPGFDVLVEGETEDITYEDDPEYSHAFDGNDGDSEHLLMPHDYAHQAEYGEREFFDNALYEEASEYYKDELNTGLSGYSPRCRQDRVERRTVARKRNILCVQSQIGGRRDIDLRDYLRKRRMVNGHDGYLETREFRHRRAGRQDRLQRHGSFQQLHGRIASKVERHGDTLHRRRNSAIDTEQQGRRRSSQSNGYRQYNGMQPRRSLSERRSYPKRERYARESTTLYEPKSFAADKAYSNLDQINKNGSVDFEGPKPLNEILKDKKKASCSGD